MTNEEILENYRNLEVDDYKKMLDGDAEKNAERPLKPLTVALGAIMDIGKIHPSCRFHR